MKKAEVQICRAVLEDADALAQIQGQAFLQEFGDGPPGYDTAEWQAEAIVGKVYYKIVVDAQIVGGVVLNVETEGECYLHRIFIAPDFQRQGAGAQALAFVESEFPCRRWTLHTPEMSAKNRQFYEKRGYKKIGEEQVYPPDRPEGFTLFHYEKFVGAGY